MPNAVGRRRVKHALEAAFDASAWTASLALTFGLTGLLSHVAQGRPAGLVLRHLLPVSPLAAAVLGGLAALVLAPCFGLAAGLYRGRFVRGSLDEVLAVAMAVAATAAGLGGVTAVMLRGAQPMAVTCEEMAASATASLAAMLGARYIVFTSRLRSQPASSSAVPIIVFGAGGAGTQLIKRLAVHPSGYRPVAVLDDDPAKRRLRVHGVPVLGTRAQMASVARQTGATTLVIALATAEGRVIRELTDLAERSGLRAKVIPSVRELIAGSHRIDSVRDPRLSDLLGRQPITTDMSAVASRISGKCVLVTGAGGSIGSELCRQLHRFGPARLFLLDHDESALHALQLELSGRALMDSDDLMLADIRDQARLREVFERCRPDVVFHAAALKHLPMLERHPAEALKSNVWGTLDVLREAAAHDVGLFVNISTDKAADPVSVLGYSKRIGERLTAQVASQADGTYLSVRFGNVLGSRGSVLTTLSAQIASGGPVTVTHPEVRRYFMTVDEAVQLVLQAAVIGDSGEALVLDMGEPVRIADIARRMIAATGRAIDLVYTGLRPGEKLSEDLLAAGEPDLRPRHPLISQVPVPPVDRAEVLRIDQDADPAAIRNLLAAAAGPVATRALHDGPDQTVTPHPSPAISPVRTASSAAVAR